MTANREGIPDHWWSRLIARSILANASMATQKGFQFFDRLRMLAGVTSQGSLRSM